MNILINTFAKAAMLAGLAVLAACAQIDPPRKTPAPIDNLGAPPAPKASLTLVQICAPNGRKCEMGFVQTKQGADTVALVRNYYRSKTGSALPAISVETSCSTGWAAGACPDACRSMRMPISTFGTRLAGPMVSVGAAEPLRRRPGSEGRKKTAGGAGGFS